MTIENFTVQVEDQERLNLLFTEIGDILSRNNDQGLELDWDHYCEIVFGPLTGYGRVGHQETIPQVFRDAYEDDS